MTAVDVAMHSGRFEFPPRPSPRATRSQSMSSDRPSASVSGYGGLISPPATVSPDPAFIATSAASQIVTNDHDSQSEIWFDQHGIEPSGETALVAPPALRLLNRFLDQLLFNFLSVSRSTSLGALRPAVYEVLKQKLAKDAIHGAEQELHEYLGSTEDDELLSSPTVEGHSGNWDLELVWKRTRLRCMVYSSLGDMEEEDEDFYTEQEHLGGPSGPSGQEDKGVVSPAVAIFLTSILEFMGEQVLVIAGQAAYHRLRAKHEKEEREGTSTHGDIAERVVVEDSDMERVALDRTLGRLWRGWKKRIRSPTTSISMRRSFSKDSLRSQPQASRKGSVGYEEQHILEEKLRGQSLDAVLNEHEHAANIPLPMSDDDVREIEIPGWAERNDHTHDGSPEEDEDLKQPARPKSMIRWPAPIEDEHHSPTSPITKLFSLMPPLFRRRSNSLPSPPPAPYRSPVTSKVAAIPGAFVGDEDKLEVGAGPAEGDDEEPVRTGAVDNASHEMVLDGSSADEEPSEKQPTAEPADTGLLAKIGASAVGVGAASGIAAAADRKITQSESHKEESDGEDDLTEEPQILTSSRVSINGSISQDDAKALSRHSSVRSPSVRSSSVHSLRLIDVPASKSPVSFRQEGLEPQDFVATGSSIHTRQRSIPTPTLSDTSPPGNAIPRAINGSPLGRNGSPVGQRQIRNSAGEPITEVDEKESKETSAAPIAAVVAVAAIPALVAGAMRASNSESIPAVQPTSRNISPQQPFVLTAAPAPRVREAAVSPAQPKAHPLSNQATEPRNSGPENSVSTRRVRKESAPAPAVENTPSPLREAARITPERHINGHSPSLSASSPIASPRTAENAKLARHSSAHVTRSSPPRASREDSIRKIVPEPISKRSTHTSGSGSSSNSHKVRPLRPSEDSVAQSMEDKSQSFEQLIRSDQTIQYTLTPHNMRNIEAGADSPRRNLSGVVPTEVQRPPSGSQSSPVGRNSALHSNPTVNANRSSQQQKPFKPVPRAYANTGTKLRPNAPQPRDARVDRDSISDFADFIRSTGPTAENGAAPRPLGVNNHRGTPGTARNVSGSVPRVSDVTPLPKRAESSAGGRRKLQARDAVVSRGDSISDLIDFVRSGPQLEKEDHRIPRTVAPFRTTMDSDQMSGAVGGKAIDANLPDPRYSQATASVNSSVNSQTALLNSSSSNRHHQASSQFDEEDMMPKRKTRRVRDPYAIDFSDEDEEQFQAASRPKAIQEESLADFLRNVPPPPEAVATSVFENVPPPPGKDIKKKNSATGLMSRFGRNSSSPTVPSKPKFVSQDSPSANSRNNGSQAPIAAKYNTMDSNRTGNSYVSQLDSARNKVAQKPYQPREAVYSNTRTNDLAEFLMRSEPPPSMDTQPQVFQKEDTGAFGRMFGRKKVH